MSFHSYVGCLKPIQLSLLSFGWPDAQSVYPIIVPSSKYQLPSIVFSCPCIIILRLLSVTKVPIKKILRENGRCMTQSCAPIINEKLQHEKVNKTPITQRLRTDLGRSVVVATASNWCGWTDCSRQTLLLATNTVFRYTSKCERSNCCASTDIYGVFLNTCIRIIQYLKHVKKEIRIARCLYSAHIVVYCPHKALAPIEHYL